MIDTLSHRRMEYLTYPISHNKRSSSSTLAQYLIKYNEYRLTYSMRRNIRYDVIKQAAIDNTSS